MQTSLLSCISGTPAENWKDEVVQIIKKMIGEGKPISFRTLNEAITQYNQTDNAEHILSEKELVYWEFQQLVTQAVWKAIEEKELRLALPE